MSRKLTVLLLEDVASLGKAGDIVTVNEGYARHALFPHGQAALADEKDRRRMAENRAAAAVASAKQLKKMQAIAEKLEGTELTLKARPKDEAGSEIYGSLTARHIAEELNRVGNFSLKPKDIKLLSPIMSLGSQDVTIHISPEIEATIHITVIADEKA